MLKIYSNMTLEEMLKEISYDNYDLFVELQTRLDQNAQKIRDKVEAEQDEQGFPMLSAIESMEYLCSENLEWIKDEQKKMIRYHVKGFDENLHYDNHNISIDCDKNNRTRWNVMINCGSLGETGSTFVVNGNFKEAQKQALDKAKWHLKRGDHFTLA